MHCTNQTDTTKQHIHTMLKTENGVSHGHLSYTPDSLYTGPNSMAQNRVLTHNIAISSYLQLCAKIVT